MKDWKMYQQLYNSLVTDHSDGSEKHGTTMETEIIENALRFVTSAEEHTTYPAKSYMVAVIYAKLLEEVYGENFYEVLNDPELLNGQDRFFIPYEEDPETYDAIKFRLETIPNWKESGWVPYTVNYFYLECTEAGVESINNVQ
jgi:hypothetical protein